MTFPRFRPLRVEPAAQSQVQPAERVAGRWQYGVSPRAVDRHTQRTRCLRDRPIVVLARLGEFRQCDVEHRPGESDLLSPLRILRAGGDGRLPRRPDPHRHSLDGGELDNPVKHDVWNLGPIREIHREMLRDPDDPWDRITQDPRSRADVVTRVAVSMLDPEVSEVRSLPEPDALGGVALSVCLSRGEEASALLLGKRGNAIFFRLPPGRQTGEALSTLRSRLGRNRSAFLVLPVALRPVRPVPGRVSFDDAPPRRSDGVTKSRQSVPDVLTIPPALHDVLHSFGKDRAP